MRKIKVGSRASQLALVQAEIIIEMLQKSFPQYEYEIIKIKTKGDKILDQTLSKIGGKGLFVKEIQTALLEEEIDLAVHSMKDMPAESPEGLVLGAITEREDPRDVLIMKEKCSLQELPQKSAVGTSSLRRKIQLLSLRKDLQMRDIRGNVGTRLEKLHTEGLDAVILAAAGLKRLGYQEEDFYYLDTTTFTPAVGQGALGCEMRKKDKEVYEMLKKINHKETYNCVMAERTFLKLLEGGCHVPIGAYGQKIEGELWINGMVASADGETILRHTEKGSFENYLEVGTKLAKEMIKLGAKELL
ncbi:hydroxymethylbilane synthase [Natronincola peptidivorans]|uniref:Porphobilinogen deaminase n=1 Tax=Natronincola peptidivorans TaxID=426128 RepID=A0A1I0CY43_9FIRM|nr:hydroxymethylbilane synthase [Natronincola peptidivorans]SET24387.1 hydroxymethylbilane synthase [Natronincola peptidivorans]